MNGLQFLGYRFPSLAITRHHVLSWPMDKKPRFVLDLEEPDRVLLEAHRVRLGLRSHAETLRALIRGSPVIVGFDLGHPEGDRGVEVTGRRNADGRFEVESFKELPPARHRSALSDPELSKRPALAQVQILARKTFNPQPKKGK